MIVVLAGTLAPAGLLSAHAPLPVTVLKAGEEREFEIAARVRMRFCWVPPGTATLGSPAAEKDREGLGPEPEHPFTTTGFWLGKFEVTQGEWTAVMGTNPSAFAATASDARYRDRVKGPSTTRFPVDNVSWDDCQAFIKKVNAYAGGRFGRFGLPHEEEWEYACRGGKGNGRVFYWGDELNGTQANCDGNYPYGGAPKGTYLKRPSVVGAYAKDYPHPWGLCDMHGNVWEWCEDSSRDGDPRRVIRGGSWCGLARNCRSAYWGRSEPTDRQHIFGCRLALVPAGR